jgi:hypothetical protein
VAEAREPQRAAVVRQERRDLLQERRGAQRGVWSSVAADDVELQVEARVVGEDGHEHLHAGRPGGCQHLRDPLGAGRGGEARFEEARAREVDDRAPPARRQPEILVVR